MNDLFVAARIAAAVAALKHGKMVIVADDDDREAEGDFIMAASLIQAQDVNLMASLGRGLICVAVEPVVAQKLELQVQGNALHSTAFTESIDYLHGTTTGISCADRALGLRKLVEPETIPADYARPGHLFPLVARAGGVLERRGHTEAAVDLCQMAGLPGAGVICEIMNPDGTMARTPQLIELASQLQIPFLTVDDVAKWKRRFSAQMQLGEGGRIPTQWGEFVLYAIQQPNQLSNGPLLLCHGFKPEPGMEVSDLLVRIHSECVTGELFGSLRCDCGPQLQESMRRIAATGKGAIIYLRQEGRGIGLAAKLRAYGLQDQGLDTIEANLALGLPADARNYAEAIDILHLIGCTSLTLLTNNPDKVAAIEASGIAVIRREPLHIGQNAHNLSYLKTKIQRCGHDLALAGTNQQ